MKKANKNFTKNQLFTSKANTLKFLQKRIVKSKIENIYDFTISEWEKNEKNILIQISKIFKTNKIIVRSSAIGEDSTSTSKAGIFESILNVQPSSTTKLKSAINLVIKSYRKNSHQNLQNQILIQKQITNVLTSGVIFTRTQDIGAPYHVINYEDGPSTVGVTKGTINNVVKIFCGSKTSKIPKKWIKLIQAIKEIESILGLELLDIEFGITKKGDVIIFQVRPITSIKESHIKILEKKISNLISKYKKQFLKLNKLKHVPGEKTIFSDMSDWNPAEIIGNNPNTLDYSLYAFLIMDKTWHVSRTILGYQNVNPYHLMIKFGFKPYVDVRASFNSLIPQNIRNKLKKKLIQFYLKKLSENPHLHDKVEFEILFSCYDLTIDSRLKELLDSGFNSKEIEEIKDSLIDFTNNVIEQYPTISTNCKNSMKKLTENRIKIMSNLKTDSRITQNLLKAAQILLHDCRKYGALPFSTMARIAFIASILLKSLQNSSFDIKFLNNFLNSISTPLSDIQYDLSNFLEGKLSKNQFLHKYGHLRPGTYDVTALRYDNDTKFLENMKFKRKKAKINIPLKNKSIEEILAKKGLLFNKIEFLIFVKESLEQREKLKFEFTKNLSEALELIAEAGLKLGFTREDLSNLEIKNIFKAQNFKKEEIQNYWKHLIMQEKMKMELNNFVVLPPIIFSENDFEYIQYYISKPNYITNKKVSSNITNLSKYRDKNQNFDNKIILIENADPGYDWIFTKNPSGLITKYGGVASHMAIRCAEVGLPAAIGCGEILYNNLTFASKVALDCKDKELLILEHTKLDEDIEAKKALKSLGYIK